MADIFDGSLTSAVPILDTATDADSPNSSLYWDKLRIFIEMLLMDLNGHFETGTLTSDPPNDATGYLIDTAASFEDDEHNGRRAIFTDGNAVGQDFLIDDTVAASDRCECTGDNLYAAGARSGDGYIIVGNFRTAGGHKHDGDSAKNFIPYLSNIGNYCGAELSVTGTTPTVVATMRFYLPEDAEKVYLHARLRRSSNNAVIKFNINSTDSNTGSTDSSTFVWVTGCELDVSAVAEGYYEILVYLYTDFGTATAYSDSLNFFIE